METLNFTEDRYNGVIIDHTSLPFRNEEFVKRLASSLKKWDVGGKRAVWLQIPSDKSTFIPLAVNDFGFAFHHANESLLVLVKWLPNEPHRLPIGSTHQVGIGAFVMNDDGCVLAVQERHGPLQGTGIWKLPTGLLNKGEDIPDGAIREVLEETGVECAFQAVVCIRQAHGFFFGNSDLFFLCVLKPLSGQTILKKQVEEIEAVCWYPYEDFISQEFVVKSEALHQMLLQCQHFMNGANNGFVGHSIEMHPTRKNCYLWLSNKSHEADLSKL